jgi:hypothetical protein
MVRTETANIKQAKATRIQSGRKKVGGAEALDSSMELPLQVRTVPQDNLNSAKNSLSLTSPDRTRSLRVAVSVVMPR